MLSRSSVASMLHTNAISVQTQLAATRPVPVSSDSRRRGLGRTHAVLAPADVPSRRRQPKSDDASPAAKGRGLARALLAALRQWERSDNPKMKELAERTAEEAEKIEQQAKAKKSAAPPVDIAHFLRPVGVLEMRYARMLSDLCALTYFMSNITKESLWHRHRLRLVTSSLQCDFSPRLPQNPLQAVVDGDAMAADVPTVLATHQEEHLLAHAHDGEDSLAMQTISQIEPIRSSSSSSTTTTAGTTTNAAAPQQQQQQSAADVVSASLSAAAAAAAAAASSAAGSVYSAAIPIAAPIANNISTFTTAVTSPVANVATQLQNAAVSGHSTAIATVATVTAAVESTVSHGRPSPADCNSPTEWFIADDEAQRVRYFVIQGSDSMDHWKVNLTFDPVGFEDATLGIKVHRGVYETAQRLYERFLPLVQEHLATAGPGARIAFSGHSLGGSLGTILLLMYVRRGVLSMENIAPVYTFGAPAVFCEGAEGGACGIDGDCGCSGSTTTSSSSGGANGILERLGLPPSVVRNVLMHRDIVPRAFACDYSLVADILRAVGESFREHRCLRGDRRMLFNFVGKIMLLQPEEDASFVCGEGFHSMLPARPGLFLLQEPRAIDGSNAVQAVGVPHVSSPTANGSTASGSGDRWMGVSNLPAGAATGMDAGTAPPTSSSATNNHSSSTSTKSSTDNNSSSTASTASTVMKATNVHEAVWHLMNNPHPLDTLADPGAYGDSGSISRYHNPDNYTKAIGMALRARGAAWRDIVKRAQRAGVQLRPPALGAVAAPIQVVVDEKKRRGGSNGGKASSPVPVHRRV